MQKKATLICERGIYLVPQFRSFLTVTEDLPDVQDST